MKPRVLSPADIHSQLLTVPEWFVDEESTTIARTFVFQDFSVALVFVNRVAEIAEEENHHPDIFIHGYKNVTISLTTHSAGGLTKTDFLVAQQIDAL